MPQYLVQWRMDIEAENPETAAQEALNNIIDKSSLAKVFDVEDQDRKGTVTHVDLWEDETWTTENDLDGDLQPSTLTDKEIETIGVWLRVGVMKCLDELEKAEARELWALAIKVDPAGTDEADFPFKDRNPPARSTD